MVEATVTASPPWQPVRVAPCACGGFLTVNDPPRRLTDRSGWHRLAVEVRRHNGTNQHRVWRCGSAT